MSSTRGRSILSARSTRVTRSQTSASAQRNRATGATARIRRMIDDGERPHARQEAVDPLPNTTNNDAVFETPPMVRHRNRIAERERLRREEQAVVPQQEIPLVDLATPSVRNERSGRAASTASLQPTRLPLNRRPLEVDLICDHEFDDELIVVLEDIMNQPANRNRAIESPMPIILGTSPPRPRQASASLARLVTEAECDSPLTCGTQASTSVPSTSEGPSEIQCPICLDTLSQIKRDNRQMHMTFCGHLFCKSCIVQVVNQTKQCPTCRRALTLKQILPCFSL